MSTKTSNDFSTIIKSTSVKNATYKYPDSISRKFGQLENSNNQMSIFRKIISCAHIDKIYSFDLINK